MTSRSMTWQTGCVSGGGKFRPIRCRPTGAIWWSSGWWPDSASAVIWPGCWLKICGAPYDTFKKIRRANRSHAKRLEAITTPEPLQHREPTSLLPTAADCRLNADSVFLCCKSAIGKHKTTGGVRSARSRPSARLVTQLCEETGMAQEPVQAISGRRVRVGDRWLVSFVSASYLGLEQDARVVQASCRAANSWGLSLGTPRALARDPVTARLETAIARFTGQPAALVFPSTTHAALDLLPLLSGPSGVIFFDARAYPTSLEGVRKAKVKGAGTYRFSHSDPAALASALQRARDAPKKVVVCDGIYPEGGDAAPLAEFASLAASADAVLYVDDSHGVGVFGEVPRTPAAPYGRRGGGVIRSLRLPSGRLVITGTLGKALGVPVAFVAGSSTLVRQARAVSETLVHSSPPSIPNMAAALEALQVNETEGDCRRLKLANLVRRFQEGLRSRHIEVRSNGLFPIQTIPFRSPGEAQKAGQFLRRMGVWPLLQLGSSDYPRGGILRFFITASHTCADIDRAVEALAIFKARFGR
jgi:8-amino-7-oxononanoate synthase